jgi:hypothetical protein
MLMMKLSVSLTLLLFVATGWAQELTVIGAQRAGNAEGTIPEWTGGILSPPASYRKGHHETDPFPDDQVLFEISAANLAAHRDHLTPGQIALLETYPDTWRMPVYATRRSASYPQYVYEALAANASNAQLVTEGRGAVTDSIVTSPFPVPGSGVEAVWNHNLRWRGVRVGRFEGSAAVTRAGRYGILLQSQDWGFPYASAGETAFKRKHPNVLLAVKAKVLQPAQRAGDGTLVWEPITENVSPRKTWQYLRGLRRVIRSPYFGYELPAPNTDGLRTVDDFGMFNGPPDRFAWQLIGKREIYIPYNAYRVHSESLKPDDIVRSGHINPEHTRYELHRVWVVDGMLNEGARHVYGRRVFYLDEDSWQIAVADAYDLEGKLMRVNEAHIINYYTVPTVWTTLEVFHSLQEGRVLVNGLDNNHRPYQFSNHGDAREFSPSALNFYLR